MDIVKLVHDKINIEEVTESVSSPQCGATSVFIGTTRDNFEDKMASMMSHDCVPNTSWVRVENADNTFSIKMWATVPIKKGALITTQYLDITRATFERRAHLQEIYYFSCTCKRCSDPRELGTNYSSVKCGKCPAGKGYLSSTEPLKGVEAPWKCDSCGGTQPYREASGKVETDIVTEIQAAEGEEALEQVLDKHSGVTVHPNHYLMMDLRQEIVKRAYGNLATIKDEAVRKERAKKVAQLCKSLIGITEVIYPGQNRIKARLAYYAMYLDALINGTGEAVEKDLEKIEDIIRQGKEMLMFEA